MTIHTKRLVQSLLLTGGLCACASGNQQRAEDPADVSTPTAERDNASELGQLTPVVPDNLPDEPGSSSPVANEGRIASDVPGAIPGAVLPPLAPMEPTSADKTATAPDNTGVNERDRDGTKLTPGDQGTSKHDLEITRRIRETVVDDASLSFTARNVKIITVDGKVTLRGPVANQNERKTIEKKALAVAGHGQVVNEIEVK